MIAVRKNLVEALRVDNTPDAEGVLPEPKVPESDRSAVNQVRGAILLGDPRVFRDQTPNLWYVYDDGRFPAREPRNEDGSPKAQTGTVRVYDEVPSDWTLVEPE